MISSRTLFDEPPDDEPTGEQEKRAVLALLEAHRPRLIRAGRRALLLHLLEHGTGTADDVRRAISPPAGIDPRAFGAVPGPLAKLGIIRANGFVKTRREGTHAARITLWKLKNRNKAVAWLAANPELPAAVEGGAA